MIIWLASYPRSGNTLLRTIIKRCFGLNSYADEAIHVNSQIRSDSSFVGHEELPTAWNEFYEMATSAKQVFLVKTHLPPRDAQPYVYIVRDGRSAVRSYKKYFEQYVPDHPANLYQIIAGDDAYGDWSSHYHAWVDRQDARGMTVRFEQLTNISGEMRGRLAAFIAYQGPVAAWENPFGALAEVEPGFFREGREAFTPDREWPELAQQFFQFFHSQLQEELGYAAGEPRAPTEWEDLFEWSRRLVGRNRQLQLACDERLQLINQLSTEAQRRLEIINSFASSTKKL